MGGCLLAVILSRLQLSCVDKIFGRLEMMGVTHISVNGVAALAVPYYCFDWSNQRGRVGIVSEKRSIYH